MNPLNTFDLSVVKNLPVEKQVALLIESTRSLHGLVHEKIRPLLVAQVEKNRHEQAMAAGYYRMCLILRAVVKLDEPEHFQMTAMAARSMFELLLDLRMLRDDSSAADKYFDFVDVDKFRKAEKLSTFLDEHPEIDSTKHKAALAFAADPARRQRLEDLCRLHWGTTRSGRPRRPRHWSGIDSISARAREAGSNYEEFYLSHYGIQSYYVHAGAAGVTNLSRESFVGLFAITHASIWWLFSEATEIVAKAFHLFDAQPELRDELSKAPTIGAISAITALLKKDSDSQNP